MRRRGYDDNWEAVRGFLPTGWEMKAKNLGALLRQRNVKDPESLLRLLLIHLADGCSLRETVVRARQARLCKLSDVALLKRLRTASEWLRWMSLELLARRGCTMQKPEWLSRYNLRSVDATVVCEPGSTGTDWRVHYSLELFSLHCDYFRVTQPEVGESFTNFSVTPGDLLLGDRGYGSLKGLWHIKNKGGDFLVRLKNKAFGLYSAANGEKFDLLKALSGLTIGEVGEWEVEARTVEQTAMRLRICAVKKSKEAAEDSVLRTTRKAKDRGSTLDPETIELQRYVVLTTSVAREHMSAEQVAELYRIRWQIEIAFKRLKSIMGLGHLPNVDPASARAWLHGKVFVALLVQAMVDEGRSFSPWGYSIGGNRTERQLVA
jgi:transposase